MWLKVYNFFFKNKMHLATYEWHVAKSHVVE